MQNLMNLGNIDFCSYDFRYEPQEERKVQALEAEPSSISLQESSDMKMTSSKLQISQTDMALIKKAKSRKTKTIEDPNSNKKCGHWSMDENKRYHWFLELHHQHFFEKHLRRTDRIFKSMATFVQTRQAEQCRSHHQKMEKKYNFFSKILISLRLQNYSCQDYELVWREMVENGHSIQHGSLITMNELRQVQQNSLTTQNSDKEEKEDKTFLTPKTRIPSFSTSIGNTLVRERQIQDFDCSQNGNNEEVVNGPANQNMFFIDNIFNDTYEQHISLGNLF